MFGSYYSIKFFDDSSELPVDILETPEYFEVQVEIPGVSKENVSVKIEDNRKVKIAVEKPAPKPEGEYLIRERFFGKVEREFVLPKKIASGKVKAELKDGVLTLVLFKEAKDIIEVEIK